MTTKPNTNVSCQILQLLGLDTTGLIEATIYFKVDDVVRIDAAYLAEVELDDEGNLKTELKQFVLAEVTEDVKEKESKV